MRRHVAFYTGLLGFSVAKAVLGDEATERMYTKSITPELLRASVLAVPPLARDRNGEIVESENRGLAKHIEAGGVSTLLYGGNANLYHCRISEYAAFLEMLERIVAEDTWVIPSVGPTFGMCMDQAAILAKTDFPTAMVLPAQGPATNEGIAEGVKRFVDAFGKPAVVYIKEDGYLEPETLARLFDEGYVSFLKYAVVREDWRVDPYLKAIVEVIDPQRIVSGIGEQPAIDHMRTFGLAGFTSGCVCLTPEKSKRMLERIQANDFEEARSIREEYVDLESLRNSINPIRVLHEAVTLSWIADMGPPLPFLSALNEEERKRVAGAVERLM